MKGIFCFFLFCSNSPISQKHLKIDKTPSVLVSGGADLWAGLSEDIPGAEDEPNQHRVSLPQTPAQRGSLGSFPVSRPLWKFTEGCVYIHKSQHHLMFSLCLCRLGLSKCDICLQVKRVLSEGHFSQQFVCV